MPTHFDACTSSDGFWDLIQAELGGEELPILARTFFRLQGFDERWAAANPEERPVVQEQALQVARDLDIAGLLNAAARVESPMATLPHDRRWRLWQELMGAAGWKGWRPLSLRRVFRVNLGHVFPKVEERVEIDMDARISLNAVKAELDRLWPELRKEGWVAPRRGPEDRKIALARFVCLESEPDTPWRERLDEWNTRYPQWTYRDPRAFQSDLRRAEVQLTGRQYALAWFYDSDARNGTYESMKPGQLRAFLRTLAPRKREHALRLRAAASDEFLEALEARMLYLVALHPEEASALDELNLAGRRLPRTDIGSWLFRTTYGHAPLGRATSTQSVGEEN